MVVMVMFGEGDVGGNQVKAKSGETVVSRDKPGGGGWKEEREKSEGDRSKGDERRGCGCGMGQWE